MKTTFNFYLIGLTLLLLASPGFSQHGSHCATPVVGWVPNELLSRPVPLRAGLGTFHDPVTTNSKEAQAFYNQGMAYLHGYVWIEAARSFQQALRHDPNLAMAYNGLSFSFSGLEDHVAAKQIMEKAKARAKRASPREQTRIAVRQTQLAAIDSLLNPKLHQTYKLALDKALLSFKDDAELWLLRGNAEEPMARGRGQMGSAASIPFYEGALTKVAGHPAAHHYLTHTYENTTQFDKALYYGELYARQALNVPHAQHMYGHDLMKVGRINEAIIYFSKTDSLERAYYAAEKIEPWLDWHHPHNMTLLAMSYQYQGQMQKAEALFKQVAGLKPLLADYAFYYKKDYPEFLLSNNRVKEALSMAENMRQAASAPERVMGCSFAGRAYLQTGKTEKARQALQAGEAQMSEVQKALPSMPGMVAYLVKPYVDLLKAELALRTPATRQEGLEQLRAFQKTARAATSPDGWIESLYRLEAIAALARQVDDLAFAEEAAKVLNEHDKQYPGSYFAQALVAEKKGNVTEAKKMYAEAVKGWARADSKFAGKKLAVKKASL